jgi:hypothetical protein
MLFGMKYTIQNPAGDGKQADLEKNPTRRNSPETKTKKEEQPETYSSAPLFSA